MKSFSIAYYTNVVERYNETRPKTVFQILQPSKNSLLVVNSAVMEYRNMVIEAMYIDPDTQC